jgi:hypothetical protein
MKEGLLHDEIYNKLPEFIEKLTSFYSDRERDIVLLSSIGVLSACMPRVYGIYDTNRYTPNLYFLLIAPPASGKGIMSKSLKLIEGIHQKVKEQSHNEIEECKAAKKENKDRITKCPDLAIKLLPGNVSSSKIYRHMQNSPEGLLIFETEADTISTMLKQDWGNFSDVLRKAFHHETISISRDIDDKFFEVYDPKLSLVISGTPNQVAPLIQSKENGLFSRFVFYYFNEPSGWKDVSPNGNVEDTSKLFSDYGIEILKLYDELLKTPNGVQVLLSDNQWAVFNKYMEGIVNTLIESNRTGILPTIKRHGLIMFRICMILTIIRNKEIIKESDILYCGDNDFTNAMMIIESTLDHSYVVSDLLSTVSNNSDNRLSMRELKLLTGLDMGFERKDAIDVGRQIGIPERSTDYILSKLIKLGIVNKLFNGNYQKNKK